jgi:outer membrane receptor for ferrienterochelin and colicins
MIGLPAPFLFEKEALMRKWGWVIGLLWVLHPLDGSATNRMDAAGVPVEDAGKVVVTATITEKDLEDAPGSVQVLTAQEIQETGATTVAEALETAVGLMVTGDTGRAQVVSIRGTGNKHSLVLVDGRRRVLGYKDFIDIHQIPVSMVERIEIVRGPNSALYGSDAIGGVVNIITRQTPDRTTAGFAGRYGDHAVEDGEMVEASAYAGTRTGPFGILLSGGYRDQAQWDEDGELPDDQDDEQLGSAAGRLSFDFFDGHELSAGFEYSDWDREGGRFYQNADRNRIGEDQRMDYYLQYEGRIAETRRLLVRAYRSEHENEIGFEPEADVTAEEDAKRYLNQVEALFTTPLLERQILSFGGDFRSEGREDSEGADDDLENASLFLQDEIQLFDPLYLVAGIRYDNHSEFGDQWTPRASLIYSFLDNLRLKAAYGWGFRAPSISELYVTSYRQRGKIVYEPNADLEAEESVSYEVGLEGEVGPFRGGVTAFRNEIENLIEPVFQYSTGSGKQKISYYTYENIAEATTQGVELEALLHLPLNFDLSGHLTYLDTENEETGEDLEGQPNYKGSLKLAYAFAQWGIRTHIRMDYVGEMYYADGDQSSYTLWNAYLSKQFGEYFNLFAGVDNIFDEQESRDGVTYLDPMLYYAGFKIEY